MRALVSIALVVFAFVEARSQGYAPEVAPGRMVAAGGLEVTLYASEPEVRQPILVKFDDRGRLWTIQYLQYPNPSGLKRVKVDRWSRTVYDRVPEPPPKGPRGADRISITEDSDGDGRADRFTDFVSGLNLCTGLEFGHGGVYVLQVPYLLFYPDRDRDDVPDGDPNVLLSGFGMEDAQSLVNHLTWGPDGWLYGVSGSTSSNLVMGVEFQQAVWRFHPLTKAFELFCEGGGNLFGLTFDPDGNLFFSSNGNDLAYHGLQGAYYRKNFGKHGPIHHAYAYGFFDHIPFDQSVSGPRPGGTIYSGATLPERFRGTLLCSEFLQHSAASWRLERHGSTFSAKFEGTLLDSRDTWFCAPDLCQGPDGAVYLCDFHDRRTAHPDPDAQWDRSNGRIYRVAPPETSSVRRLDLARKSSGELLGLLQHPNGWYADRARVELSARHDPEVWPALSALARQTKNPRLALQGLWALQVSGGLEEPIAEELLRHPSEYVRAWTIRLIGDNRRVSPLLGTALAGLAVEEPSVIVRCQLAATARRLPGEQGVSIVENLLGRGLDYEDPRIPLMLWWAVEAKAFTESDKWIRLFGERDAWSKPLRLDMGLRLIRRFAAEGTRTGYELAERLLATAPVDEGLKAVDIGLAERGVAQPGGMGMVGLFDSVSIPRRASRSHSPRFETLSPSLTERITRDWRHHPTEITRLRLALRAELPVAAQALREAILAPATEPEDRRNLLGLMAEMGTVADLPLALGLLEGNEPFEVKAAALDVVTRFGDDRATVALLKRYPEATPELRSRIREVLLSRPESTRAFLERVDRKEIMASEVPIEQLRLVSLHEVPELDLQVRKHWGRIQAGTAEERLAEVRRLTNDLRAGDGDRGRGKLLFQKHCATCHKLSGEGGEVGPDLTGLSRDDPTALLVNIVDPNAVIRAQYQQYAAVTRDGRIVTGILANQDQASLTFIDAQNKRATVSRGSVEELRELPNSIMPENLLNSLTPQEVRDLFQYLRQSPR